MVLAALHGARRVERRPRPARHRRPSLVQIDPWPAGTFGVRPRGRPPDLPLPGLLREHPDDNGYAHPIEGVIAFVDMARGEVLEVVDTGVVPIPPESGSYYPEDNGPPAHRPQAPRDHPARGAELRGGGQPGPLAEVVAAGAMDPVEGLVLHTRRLRGRRPGAPDPLPGLGQRDGRSLRRPRPHARLEERLRRRGVGAGAHGQLPHPGLRLPGRDPLLRRRLRHRDAASPTRWPTPSACTRRTTGSSGSTTTCVPGRTEVRRSRRLVVSSIATVGNYEYGFFWYFYLDGTIQFEVKLTGIMSTMAVAPGTPSPTTPAWWRPGWPRPSTSTCSTSASTSTSTAPTTRSTRSTPWPSPPGPDNPWRNAFGTTATLLETELAGPARRRPVAQPAPGRSSTPPCATGSGQPSAYKLVPGSTPTLLADPELERGPPGRLRHPQPVGHAVSTRTSAGPRATTPTSTPAATACPRGRPPDRHAGRHRRRALAHLRRHPHPPARGLAGDAGRVHRVHAGPLRLLRPQPGARRAAQRGALPCTEPPGVPPARRGVPRDDARRSPRKACR